MRFCYSILFILYLATWQQVMAGNYKADSQLCSYSDSNTENNTSEFVLFESPENGVLPFGLLSEKESTTRITEHFSVYAKKKISAANNVIYNNTQKNYYQTQSFFISGKCTGSKKQFLKLKILLI